MIKQKARVRWALEGDENIRFFHSIIRHRYTRSNIRGLIINGVWNDNPNDVKAEALRHFSNVFSEPNELRPSMEDLCFPVISSDEAASLECRFLEPEVLEAINIVGEISRGCNASFVTLIPKKLDPSGLGNFRPISLIGSYYKIVAKILSNRLRKVLPSLVGVEQSAFLKGRFILDGVLIANETVEYLKGKHKKGFFFKVDFEKAFDSLNWNFPLEVMKSMGFGIKWRKWILACLKSASISILVNGSPTNEFSLGRGVRQGDPLSPFLFILASEGLNILTKVALGKGLFKGIELGNDKVLISHLQYADDTMFFGEWSHLNACNLMNLLKCFELTSGLKINFHKSCVYRIGIDHGELEMLSHHMGCQVGRFPFVYLGLPIGSNMKTLNDWRPVIDKFDSRLSSWKMKSLSFRGRLVLIKSVLSSLPLYYFSLYRASPCVLKHLESVRRKFFWGGSGSGSNISWVKWDCNSIEDSNVHFKSSFIKSIGGGDSTSFWHDHWIGDNALRFSFPRLFHLDQFPDITIKDRMCNGVAVWHWKRSPSCRVQDELNALTALLATFEFDPISRDKWSCCFAPNEVFSVRALASEIDSNLLVDSITHQGTFRNNLTPKKVEIFAWRALKKRLPIMLELDKRGIDLHSVCCPLCDDDLESVEHSLIFCKHAMDVWERVFNWWGAGNFSNFSLFEIFNGNGSFVMSGIGKKIWQAVLWISAYLIWKNNNIKVFQGTEVVNSETEVLWLNFKKEKLIGFHTVILQLLLLCEKSSSNMLNLIVSDCVNICLVTIFDYLKIRVSILQSSLSRSDESFTVISVFGFDNDLSDYICLSIFICYLLVTATMSNDSSVSSAGITKISKLEFNDPLYLHPSDTSDASLITQKYEYEDDEVLLGQWDRCNSVVLTWILMSLFEDVYNGQIFSKTVEAVWNELKETYDKIDASVTFNLYQKINSCSQSGQPLSDYYHKLNVMWRKFDDMIKIDDIVSANKSFQEHSQFLK
ncbi:uncharacterized protein [Rutidosis leptorrhynchoides]|uniref:uncharacterized protein n=1 Tax=Rutidosis leptorrhynchoides TaxID=125765 RepID=UPI003A9A63F5